MFEMSYIRRQQLKASLLRGVKVVAVLALALAIGWGGWSGLRKAGVLVGPSRGSKAPSAASVSEITAALEAGSYLQAREAVAALGRRDPAPAGLAPVRDQMEKPLQVAFKIVPFRRGRLAAGQERGAAGSLALNSKDAYILELRLAEPAYLYLFQHQASGKLARLFPDRDKVPTGNPYPGGGLRIPDGYDWLYLDKTPGTETIYVLASRWRQAWFESAFEEVARETDPKREAALVAALLERIGREQVAARALPGLVVAAHRFDHLADNAPKSQETRP